MDLEEQDFLTTRPRGEELTELHIHAGGGLATSIMWAIAHEQGIRLPFKSYWDFKDFITISPDKRMNLKDMLYGDKNPFDWCEIAQSSPTSMDTTIYEIAAKSYRSCNITRMEIRFTPTKRNRSGERDLDHIIMGALRGVDRVMLEYPIKVGLIFCLEKGYSYQVNEAILKKALKYKSRGIIGVDLTGYDHEHKFNLREQAPLFQRAREAGLGVTIHAGEGPDTISVTDAITLLSAQRIGHGIDAVQNEKELELIREHDITLEFCPTANINVGILPDIDAVRGVVQSFLDHGVKFSINTDNPVFFGTSMKNEMRLLRDNQILTDEQLAQCNQWAHAASFIA
jgi:adenosine deaminase